MQAMIQSQSCAIESMTRQLSKIKPSFGLLLSVDKLGAHLLEEKIELFVS
jgi:hypothetical protein